MGIKPLSRRVFTAVDIHSDSRPETDDEKRVQIIFKVDMPFELRPDNVDDALRVVKLLAHSAPLPSTELRPKATRFERIQELYSCLRLRRAVKLANQCLMTSLAERVANPHKK